MSRYAVLNNPDHQALQWYVENGVDECLTDKPVDRTAAPVVTPQVQKSLKTAPIKQVLDLQTVPQDSNKNIMGTAEAIIESQKLANSAQTLEELKQVIESFDGLSVKKTATNMVFSDGNPDADIMVIGEAPGADEDIQGKPFVGISGQLLDKIFASINLDRHHDDAKQALYISNILNWRPPGNRTPTQAEIDIAIPFIDKHIALAKPKIIVLCGAVAAKGVLKQNLSISKLRKTFHNYQTSDGYQTMAMVTYHPAYLLRTPSQKRATWADMLMLKDQITKLP